MEKRLSSGLAFNANYTWSKSIDDASDVGTTFAEVNIPQDVYSVRNERALSSFDRRHRSVFSLTYSLPIGLGHSFSPRGIAGKVVSGWTFAGLGSAQSGAPFTVTLPTDNANIGAGPAQRPSVIGNPNAGAPHTPQQWFNTSVFLLPGQFMFGSAGRNIVRGDGEVGMDVSLLKETPVSERIGVQLRAEMFNAWNHTNFADTPGRIAFTPTFGRYTSALNPRQLQLAISCVSRNTGHGKTQLGCTAGMEAVSASRRQEHLTATELQV